MTIYDFSIPAGGLNSRKLRAEVFSSLSLQNQVGWSGAPVFNAWPTSGTCHVDFGAASLDSGQQSTLASLISAHTTGDYTAYCTRSQLMLEPGSVGNQLWVPDYGPYGAIVLYDGTQWRPLSRAFESTQFTTSDQTGITSTSPVNISGLSKTLPPWLYRVHLWIRYQGSATTATLTLDFDTITRDNWMLMGVAMKSPQGSTAASSIASLHSSIDNEGLDLVNTSALTATATTYLAYFDVLVNITNTSTIQPRVKSSGIGTISLMTGCAMLIKEA